MAFTKGAVPLPSIRHRVAALIAATVTLVAVGLPTAGAGAWTMPAFPLTASSPWAGMLPSAGAVTAPVGGAFGPCATSNTQIQGPAGGTEAKICQGAGLAYVGPAVGEIATVIGPTIMGPAVVGPINVSAGPGIAG
jgi:hypothetical protein